MLIKKRAETQQRKHTIGTSLGSVRALDSLCRQEDNGVDCGCREQPSMSKTKMDGLYQFEIELCARHWCPLFDSMSLFAMMGRSDELG